MSVAASAVEAEDSYEGYAEAPQASGTKIVEYVMAECKNAPEVTGSGVGLSVDSCMRLKNKRGYELLPYAGGLIREDRVYEHFGKEQRKDVAAMLDGDHPDFLVRVLRPTPGLQEHYTAFEAMRAKQLEEAEVHRKLGRTKKAGFLVKQAKKQRMSAKGICNALAGKPLAGDLLYHILWWFPLSTAKWKGRRFLVKTREELAAELAFSRNQYERALSVLVKEGLVEVERHKSGLYSWRTVSHFRPVAYVGLHSDTAAAW